MKEQEHARSVAPLREPYRILLCIIRRVSSTSEGLTSIQTFKVSEAASRCALFALNGDMWTTNISVSSFIINNMYNFYDAQLSTA
jgi:hypothetical protein